MASLASPYPRLLSATEFLRIDFGSHLKAELDDGVIRMMGGGSIAHARVQMNLYRTLASALRGSGCRPYGSDAAVETHDRSVRYPDVTIDCARGGDLPGDLVLREPRVIIEVLSPSTRTEDAGVKLVEYRALATVETIVLVDPDAERCRVVQRTGPGAWSDVTHSEPADIAFPSLGISIPHDEIFARD
ncbi:MAG: Uma2 family endonuclease [Janthinobacterium lividum]